MTLHLSGLTAKERQLDCSKMIGGKDGAKYTALICTRHWAMWRDCSRTLHCKAKHNATTVELPTSWSRDLLGRALDRQRLSYKKDNCSVYMHSHV